MRLDQQKFPDFNMLVSMHEDDPESFEAYRKILLRKAVEDAPANHRPSLEKLLHRIESARETAETPMEAILLASRMMQESVAQLSDAWCDVQHAVAELQTTLLIERLRA